MARSTSSTFLLAAIGLVSIGCASGSSFSLHANVAPALGGTQNACDVHDDRLPQSATWSPAERKAFERQAKQGLVVVRDTGCGLVVLPDCTARGTYRYQGGPSERERRTYENAQALKVNLSAFGADTRQGGTVTIDTATAGGFVSGRSAVPASDLVGYCYGATHVVGGYTAGAFALDVVSSQSSEGKSVAIRVGIGAEASEETRVTRYSGSVDACGVASRYDTAPPHGCEAPLALALAPITAPAPTAGAGAWTLPSGAVWTAPQSQPVRVSLR